MQKSNIEYLTHSWNFQTGCRNQKNGVCALPCWAKAMAHRFGRSFEPTFHIDTFRQIMPENARIGVCFTGDLFGDWVNPDMLVSPLATLKDLTLLKIEIERQHSNQFFFLTKCPQNLRKWGGFPTNAYVGVSACNFKMAVEAIGHLFHVDAKNKWLSIEPMLEKLTVGYRPLWWAEKFERAGINWLVIGAQTQPQKLPEKAWVDEIISAAELAQIPYWVKNNLKPLMGDKLHQEFPQ